MMLLAGACLLPNARLLLSNVFSAAVQLACGRCLPALGPLVRACVLLAFSASQNILDERRFMQDCVGLLSQ